MSTVAKKVLMGSGAVAEPLEIEQSLIFDGTSGKLSKTYSSSGNRKTWTYSTWLKIPYTGSVGQYLFGWSYGGSPWTQSSIAVNGSRQIQIYSNVGAYDLRTTRLLRDPSAWYHIVVAMDTTQGTAANRLKIYVNGVQETSFATATYPNQNVESRINEGGYPQNIGWTNTYYAPQYLAETHFVDGTALTSSSFGETNSDTGQWIPKEYSGSYGTNGFYLPFSKNGGGGSAYFAGNESSYLTLSANSLNLGTNNFTLEGWVYTTSTAQQAMVGNLTAQHGYGSYLIILNDSYTTKKVRFYCRYNGGTVLDITEESGTLSVNSWNHIAVTRDSANLRIFINGTQAGSTNTTLGSHTIDPPQGSGNTSLYYVGRTTDADSYSGSRMPLIGYLSNLRVVIGTAVYTSNFTPSTTPLTNIANTTLLMNGGVSSLVGPTPTVVGSVSFAVNQPFGSSVTTFASDTSGQGNNFTVSNLANSDVVIDTPTNNFCTLNSVDGGATFSEGNLKATTAASDGRRILATIGVESGKWYWEFKPLVNVTNGIALGVTLTSDVTSGNLGASAAPAWGWYSQNTNDGYSVISGTYSQIGPYMNADDVIGAALDLDNSTITFYKNGSAANLAITIPSSGLFIPVFGDGSNSAGSTFEVNFGQKTFAHTPPSGFLALSTANLPDPAIPLPSAHFNTVLYTGNGSTQSISGVGHQPDFVWIKNRSAADNHKLTDAVRGVTKELESNTGDAEVTNADGLTAFASDGFALGDDDEYNTNSEAYVSWNWKANGAGSTDTSGDIDAVVSANQTAGFSIVTWTGDGSNGTVPHGLGVAPEMVMYKGRTNSSSNWFLWTTAIDGTDDELKLNTTAAASNFSSYGSITSSFISNAEFGSAPVLAYCFASKPGFSKIGLYTGNGNADGPFVNTGFKPAWLLYKITSTTITNGGDWGIRDLKRDPANVSNTALYANLNAAEGTTSITFDILSNGFKARSTNSDSNQSGQTFLYIAFAESPFKTANAH